jgi:hypothetical protein
MDWVLVIFPHKRTKTSGAPVIPGLPEGITFPEPENTPQLSASTPTVLAIFRLIRSYRCLSG